VLLLAFVSLVTALLPLLLGLTAVAAGLGLVGQISHAFAVQDSAETVILLIGLSWLPLFLSVTLFGLLMDYPVFILSRSREAVSSEPAQQAVRRSISRSADVITAAALVMVCVFALFGALASLDLKQVGAGLTVAVLIDATVIRNVLLPAATTVLGEQNWYLPRWLAWRSRWGWSPWGLALDRSGLTLSLPGRMAHRVHQVPRPGPDLT